jgi:hypothetical protein
MANKKAIYPYFKRVALHMASCQYVNAKEELFLQNSEERGKK